jgi:hypothetical protein
LLRQAPCIPCPNPSSNRLNPMRSDVSCSVDDMLTVGVGVPGDCTMLDLATHLPFGRIEWEVRHTDCTSCRAGTRVAASSALASPVNIVYAKLSVVGAKLNIDVTCPDELPPRDVGGPSRLRCCSSVAHLGDSMNSGHYVMQTMVGGARYRADDASVMQHPSTQSPYVVCLVSDGAVTLATNSTPVALATTMGLTNVETARLVWLDHLARETAASMLARSGVVAGQ